MKIMTKLEVSRMADELGSNVVSAILSENNMGGEHAIYHRAHMAGPIRHVGYTALIRFKSDLAMMKYTVTDYKNGKLEFTRKSKKNNAIVYKVPAHVVDWS